MYANINFQYFSPILAITQYVIETFDGTVISMCLSQGDQTLPFLFFVLSISVFFFLPLAILLMLYVLIAKTLMEHPNIMAPSKNNAIPPQMKYRKQVILMLGTVVLAFFICLFPFRVFTLWILIAPAESVVELGMEAYYNILYFCRIMIYINSAINPILYNIMSSKFRGGFLRLCGVRRILSKCGNKGNRKPTFNMSSTQHSSHQTESFFSRYSSSKNTSRTSSSLKDSKDTYIFDKDNATKVKNIEKCFRESYVRLSSNLKNGESYV